ncbi:NADH-ubiquinone oxidoreductase-F iron-sulfur binding region domain-containing protein [Pseudonocardia ailaonensis]|uniref:NADH-ubiquinone oxidoreductase-F iron-sulfur binding region domain-containing protein n=1 Tax=Pseudonocardia ailaonensis TaxID=367279 RepID=A0ABN2N372_9PSEU
MTVLDPTTRRAGLLDAAEPDPDAHRGRHGPLPEIDLVTELQRAGLTGRGGAAFPVWRKLAAVSPRTTGSAGPSTRSTFARRRAAAATGPVLVANGAEGEPRSAKDRTLLTHGPHLVLDGLEAAARAVGARRCVLLAHPDVVERVRPAAAERGIAVVAGDGGFLDGEETAAVARIEGRPPVPADKTRRLVERGIAVLNVETLAHIGLVARRGADWFRSAGTADEPGTMLVTGPGGVGEVELGTPLPEVLGEVRGPVLVGGFHGAWLAPGEVLRARLSRESLREFGAAPGAGVLHVPAPGRCGLVETAEITTFLAGASARQCGPCRNGLPALADLLHRLAAGHPHTAPEIARISALLTGRGACHHPDGTVRLVRSALRVFATDVDAHLRGGCLATGQSSPPHAEAPR